MTPRWTTLGGKELVAYRAAAAFLKGRLEKRETIDWALQLKPGDLAKRAAILDLIEAPAGDTLHDPWLSAWRLIQESWDSPIVVDHNSSQVFHIQQQLRSGDRSAVIIARIVQLVSAQIQVRPLSEWRLEIETPPKTPRKVDDLLATQLASGEVVDPEQLGLSLIKDVAFLLPLARALDAAVMAGLDMATRIGWDEKKSPYKIGLLNRVYYVTAKDRPTKDHEPDEFHHGLAPSVKILHSVVALLAGLNAQVAADVVQNWRRLHSPIYLRLWAAMSRDSRITAADDAASFLLRLDKAPFWNQNVYPEIAELRALRFREFPPSNQKAIAARLRRLPPRALWPTKAEKDRVERARVYWAVREFRRIELTGAQLPEAELIWMKEQIKQFPELTNMGRVDEGFMGTPKAQWVMPNPDARYDLLLGEERLQSLEIALTSSRGEWDDGFPGRAADWIRQTGNQLKLVADLETTSDGGAAFPSVWDRFGWAHSPGPAANNENAPPRNLTAEAERVLHQLNKLPEKTLRVAIDGISNWLSVWEKQVISNPTGLAVWLKLWPIAVDIVNTKKTVEGDIALNTVARPSPDHEPMDLDTLNTSVGKLVGVFLAACPSIKLGDQPFHENAVQTQMRDMMEASIDQTGHSSLIVRYRLVEALFYFLNADLEWTKKHLIPPLLAPNSDALTLWRAVGRRTRFFQELNLIGDAMVEKATDQRLGRETRQSLAFSLVIEGLHSFQEGRSPAVAYARIQQMIRSLDDEVRAFSAGAVQRFVREASAANREHPIAPSPEVAFRTAARPFLQQVWPQERSLTTPGVSKALADLPATSRGAFVDAVSAVERFLVPFDCWSMLDYGFYGEEDGEAKLSRIDDNDKAAALLILLDRTIGDAETAVVPMDLSDALDQIRKIAPAQTETQIFRRLATVSRRG